MIEGIDYSYARPGGAAIKAAGRGFVVRYLMPGQGKGLRSDELADLKRHGIGVAVVYEYDAATARGGYETGVEHGRAAQAQLESLDLDNQLPIYFAIDWDAAESEQRVIDQYLAGAATVVGKARVGVYGGYWIVKRCKENDSAAWLWQTYAWSGGNVLDGIHLLQYSNGEYLNGEVDYCRAYTSNYGQRPVGSKPSKPSKPKPSKPASSSKTYTVAPGDTLSGIASKFGTTWQRLYEANRAAIGGDPDLIHAGTVLTIGGKHAARPAAPGARTYTVKGGDSLSSIAARYGTTWQRIYSDNRDTIGGDPDHIEPGQRLRV